MTAFTVGSIRERKSWAKMFRRKPAIQYFTVIGIFEDRQKFLEAFKYEIDEDVYDRRTIQWHEEAKIPEGQASIMTLDLDRRN